MPHPTSTRAYQPPHLRGSANAKPRNEDPGFPTFWERLGAVHGVEARVVLSGPHMNKQGGSRDSVKQREMLDTAEKDWNSGCLNACSWLVRDAQKNPIAIVNIFRPESGGAFVHRLYAVKHALHYQSQIIKESLEHFRRIHPEVRAMWALASNSASYQKAGFQLFVEADMKRKNARATRKTCILVAILKDRCERCLTPQDLRRAL